MTHCDLILLTSLSSKCSKISVEEEAKVIFIWGRLCLSSAMRRLFHLVLILLLSAPLRDDNCVDVRILRGHHRHCCSDLGHLFYTTLLLLLYLFLIRAKGILFWGRERGARKCGTMHDDPLWIAHTVSLHVYDEASKPFCCCCCYSMMHTVL